jgi:ATP-dependent exoDNAse (exonuclease V) beta subunit
VKPTADAEARRRIHEDLDHNMIVEAAAGTGKTTALVGRIVAVLAEARATVDSLVAVTFTEKAAGELKLRLRTELEGARATADAEVRPRLEEALARLEEARVGTIHGFCADLLRERSIEARVDPGFSVLTEGEDERLWGEAFHGWLERRLEDPPEGLRRSLRRPAREGPVERLRRAGHKLVEWRDFPAAWRRDPFPREERVDALVASLVEFAALSDRARDRERDGLFRDTAPARRLAEAIARAEQVRARDHDWLEGALIDLLSESSFRRPHKGRGKSYGQAVERGAVLEAHEALVAALESFRTAADADLAALLQRELAEVSVAYERLKERNGKLDFVDLLLRARDLVRGNREVREHYQERLTHLFVDEFQDTDPLQAEILFLLAASDPAIDDWRRAAPAPGKLFLVADPKQSIYRFRRADVGTYFEVCSLLEGPATVQLRLTTSFRAVPAIQRAVNAAFAPEMDGNRERLQAEYVPLAPWREELEGQPAVVALPVPEPYGPWGRVNKEAIERSFPGAVAAFVDWLVRSSGWRVTERQRPGVPVPLEARHVAILFRRFDGFYAGDVTRPYVRALEARGIRHLLVGGRSFHEREEVATLRTALTALEWPDDELSVFATLRGALFGIGDEELLEFRDRFRRLHPFRLPSPTELPGRLAGVAAALGLLRELHLGRNRRQVAETIRLLLERTRAHAGFALRPSGEQVLANVLYVSEKARQYDGSGGISFRGFVERLIEDAERGRAPEAPILEEGSDGVRVMTVHKAKGLEFPVVVLADPSASIGRREADRTIDAASGLCAVRIGGWSPAELRDREPVELARDAAEGVRLVYVAATRARDLLVLPAVGDQPYASGWTAPLNRALYPSRDRWSRPEPLPGGPEFGPFTVLNHPDPDRGEQVRPGRHVFEETGHEVVWWDPARLELDVPERFGIRREELIRKDAPAEVVQQGIARHAEWLAGRDDALARGTRPSLAVHAATAYAATAEEIDTRNVELVALPADLARPGGLRFGSLVHAVLATVALDADRAAIEGMAALQGRVLGAEEAEIVAAIEAVALALEHPLLEGARRAEARGEVRRESPLMIVRGDGEIVDGVADLAWLDGGAWTVVDFKTDRELEGAEEPYRRQVALYAEAIAAATGLPARAVLLRL